MLPTFSVVTLLVGLLLIACLSILRAQQAVGSRGLSYCVLLGYIVTLLYITVFSRTAVLDIRYQLIPFFEFNVIKGIGFLENMILFVPAGALLLACTNLPARYGFVFSFLLSSGIELIQFITHRGITDIDDLLANTLGAALGTVFYLGMQELTKTLFPE